MRRPEIAMTFHRASLAVLALGVSAAVVGIVFAVHLLKGGAAAASTRLQRAAPPVVAQNRGEDPAGEEERPSDLLVPGRSERREPFRRSELCRFDEQPRLADAWLAFERQRRQAPCFRGGELLHDRAELDLATDDGPSGPPDVESEGGDERRGSVGLGDSAFHPQKRT